MHSRILFQSPLASVADVDCSRPKSPCGGEEHACGHLLVFVRRGVWTKHSGAGARQVLHAEPTHALFFNAHEPYRVSHPAAGGDACTVLEFPPELAHRVASRYAARGPGSRGDAFGIARAPLTAAAAFRLRSLRRMARSERVDALAIEEEAVTMLAAALRDGAAAHGRAVSGKLLDTARRRRELVERAKLALACAPGAPWSLAQLAREVHSSPFHLTRVFRELVGAPVHQYLLRLRLTAALESIEEGNGNLSSIALQLGFSSHSHLSSLFRRAYGVSPSAFGARAAG